VTSLFAQALPAVEAAVRLAEALPTMPFTDHAVRRRGRPDVPYARANQAVSGPDR